MIRAIQITLIFALGTAPVAAQQVASVDLTRERTSAQSAREPIGLPKGCQELSGGAIGDGAVMAPGGERREIAVEMIKVSNESPLAGEELLGQVRLRNISKYSISIPWSIDPAVATVGQDLSRIDWEEGEFRIVLERSDLLETLSRSLYGSRFVAGSLLTIRPGEWIIADLKFRLALQYPVAGRSIGKGQGQLRVEWEQATRARGVKNCAVSTGWFTYRNYYRQQSPSLTITIN